jgi:hypothetical protein
LEANSPDWRFLNWQAERLLYNAEAKDGWLAVDEMHIDRNVRSVPLTRDKSLQ